jgi:hypothetical protein
MKIYTKARATLIVTASFCAGFIFGNIMHFAGWL